MIKIKVCGMTKIEQIYELGKLGVDFVGFIFYEKSPRYVLNHLSESDIKNIKGNFKKAGVFVNASEDFILKTMDECGLDIAQLHGNETPELVEKISLKHPVVKAFGVSEQNSFNKNLLKYKDVADYFLFDTSSANFGGTGKKFDWNLLNKLSVNKPFFLSGGIDADDVSDIFSLTKTETGKHLFSLDINSKFEHSPGVKNIALIEEFVQKIKG